LPALLLLGAGIHAGDRELGVEVQLYPTGVVNAVGAKIPLGDDASLTFRAGYNSADRDDNGEHADEQGGGPGVSIGYRRMLFDADRGWFAGARADVWLLEIDWIDMPGSPGETRGTSDVIVLQPTAAIGYRQPFGKDRQWNFEPAVSLGVEWNVDTDGADVGQGLILLVGASVSRRF